MGRTARGPAPIPSARRARNSRRRRRTRNIAARSAATITRISGRSNRAGKKTGWRANEREEEIEARSQASGWEAHGLRDAFARAAPCPRAGVDEEARMVRPLRAWRSGCASGLRERQY